MLTDTASALQRVASSTRVRRAAAARRTTRSTSKRRKSGARRRSSGGGTINFKHRRHSKRSRSRSPRRNSGDLDSLAPVGSVEAPLDFSADSYHMPRAASSTSHRLSPQIRPRSPVVQSSASLDAEPDRDEMTALDAESGDMRATAMPRLSSPVPAIERATSSKQSTRQARSAARRLRVERQKTIQRNGLAIRAPVPEHLRGRHTIMQDPSDDGSNTEGEDGGANATDYQSPRFELHQHAELRAVPASK